MSSDRVDLQIQLFSPQALSLFHRRSNKSPQQTGFLIDSFLLAESAFLNQPWRQQLLIKGLKSNTRMSIHSILESK